MQQYRTEPKYGVDEAQIQAFSPNGTEQAGIWQKLSLLAMKMHKNITDQRLTGREFDRRREISGLRPIIVSGNISSEECAQDDILSASLLIASRQSPPSP